MTTIPKFRRLAVAVLAAATASAGLLPLSAAPAGAVAGFRWERLAGADRFDTARRIAVDTFGQAQTVLLARADLFPDALSGSYLAGSTGTGAPILLTEVNRLPQATNEALVTLGTERVILLGGPAAISPAVEAELRSRNFTVERIGGRDRFETSQQVAERPLATNVGSVDGDRTAIVSSGRNFPDALAGGPLAFASRLPIVLTDTNFLPQPARNALTNLSIRRVFLLGGTAAVSSNVEGQLRDMGITVERLGGANRQATAVTIAEVAITRLGFSDTHINLARGDNFADALSGGPHSGDESARGTRPGAQAAPIVLTQSPTVLSTETSDFLSRRANTLRDGHIFGGTAAVSDAVAEEAARAAGAGRSVVTVQQTSVRAGETVTGNVSGSPERVFVSGCGLNERQLTLASNGDFSVVIPTNQPAGNCTLTFRMTFANGATETQSVQLTITAPLKAATAAPELLSATFVRTFSQANPGGASFDQTVIRFTFDEPVTGQALISANGAANSCTAAQAGCSEKFKLYRFDQTPDVLQNPNRVYEGQAAQIDPNDTSSVLVTFGESAAAPSGTSRGVGATELLEITVAAVDQTAVRDVTNVPNPFGDAALNALSFEPGRTVAPDLVNVTNFRPNFDGTRTLVDFVFDQPAVNNTTVHPLGGYLLILNDADVTKRECNFQQGTGTTPPTGDGTTVHTVSCPLVGLTQLTAANVARGVTEPRVVAAVTRGTGGPGSTPVADQNRVNPLQAHPVTAGGATTRPDLVSVRFFDGRVDGTPANFDQAIYTFDEPVLVATAPRSCGATCFAVYTTDGKEIFSSAEPVRSTTNDSQVIVTFPDGTVNNATGASVIDGAVLEAVGTGGVNRTNREDEVAVQGVTFAAGLTTAPDLTACRLDVTQRDPISGNPTAFELVFVFDEAVDGSTTASGPQPDRFVVYDRAGEVIAPRTAEGAVSTTTPTRRAAPKDNEVVLSGFRNQSDLRNVASCGVNEGAVSDARGEKNPIGYEIVSSA